MALGGDAAGDVYVSVENINGTAFNDFLEGNDLPNTILGGGGDNVIRGLGGDDWFAAAPAAIRSTQARATTGSLAGRASIMSATMTPRSGSWSGRAAIFCRTSRSSSARASADHLTGTSGSEEIDGGGGDDQLTGGGGNDTLDGGEGNDQAFLPGRGATI